MTLVTGTARPTASMIGMIAAPSVPVGSRIGTKAKAGPCVVAAVAAARLTTMKHRTA